MSLSYAGIAHADGAAVPFWEMFKVTIVGNTVREGAGSRYVH